MDQPTTGDAPDPHHHLSNRCLTNLDTFRVIRACHTPCGEWGMDDGGRPHLWGRERRYMLTELLWERGPMTVAELARTLAAAK